MQIGDVFDEESFDVLTAAVEVDRVEIDSRKCEFATLFFALSGSRTDGAMNDPRSKVAKPRLWRPVLIAALLGVGAGLAAVYGIGGPLR